jgi:hypothetical protein
LRPADVLSLADFAYVFHSLFGDATNPNHFGPSGNSAHSRSAALGYTLSALSSLSATAAALYSKSPNFNGTPQEHNNFIRQLAIGRGDAIQNALFAARDAFEGLDEDDEGEIPLSKASDWLSTTLPSSRDVKKDTSLQDLVKSFETSKTPSKASSSSKDDGSDSDEDSRKKKKKKTKSKKSKRKGDDSDEENKDNNGDPDSDAEEQDTSSITCNFPELIVHFGVLIEALGEGDSSSAYNAPSIPTAFAELRLHNKSSAVREAGESVKVSSRAQA